MFYQIPRGPGPLAPNHPPGCSIMDRKIDKTIEAKQKQGKSTSVCTLRPKGLQSCKKRSPKPFQKHFKLASLFGLGWKRGFKHPSHTGSLILEDQGTRKEKKVRSKIGAANRHSPLCCFSILGPSGRPKGPKRLSEG